MRASCSATSRRCPIPRRFSPIRAIKTLAEVVPPRPPGFCIGCPERPIFAAMKLVEEELGQHHVSADIGCHLFSILPPFNIGATTMGYGLGPASASAFNVPSGKRSISVLGDGGFWHNGLASSIGNAVFNKHDGVTLIVDNYYSAATGGQDIPSSRALNPRRKTNNSIVDAVRGVGAKWVRQIDRTYDVARLRDTLREALTTKAEGPKIIVASSECMLNKQRRVRPLMAKAIKAGERVVRGEVRRRRGYLHAAITPASGFPAARRSSVKHTDDPLKDDPIAAIDENCVGCGNCGEVAEAAALCPSFYRAEIDPQSDRLRPLARSAARQAVIDWFEERRNSGPRAARREASVNEPAGSRAPGRSPERISIAILAMGGQGGGVLADWIVSLAEAQGWAAQSTSVPGVAQRTGATIYYIETALPRGDAQPVFALMPTPGDVDVRDGCRTDGGRTLGAARPRDARAHDADRLDPSRAGGGREADARRRRRRPRGGVDRDGIRGQARHRLRHGGDGQSATAASSRRRCSARSRPPARCRFRATRSKTTIRAGGTGVEASLRAFGAAFDQTQHESDRAGAALPREAVRRLAGGERETPNSTGSASASRAFPAEAQPMIATGARRLVDYLDPAYAVEYLDRLDTLRGCSTARTAGRRKGFAFTTAAAKYLAAAMAYDDRAARRGSEDPRVPAGARAARGRRGARRDRDDDRIFPSPRRRVLRHAAGEGWGEWIEARPRLRGCLAKSGSTAAGASAPTRSPAI